MKKYIVSLIAFLLLSVACFAGTDKVIKDTTVNKVVYHLYEGSRGGHYIIVKSKAGKEYKRYFKRG